MEFTRQEYWSGLPWPSLGDLPDPGVELMSLMSPALIGSFFNSNATWEAQTSVWSSKWAYYLHSYLDLRCHVLQLWKWVSLKSWNVFTKKEFLNVYYVIESFFFWVLFESGYYENWVSLVVQMVKNPPAMWETWVWSLGWEDSLEKGKATHSSILAWRIPWTVCSMGMQRVRHD